MHYTFLWDTYIKGEERFWRRLNFMVLGSCVLRIGPTVEVRYVSAVQSCLFSSVIIYEGYRAIFCQMW